MLLLLFPKLYRARYFLTTQMYPSSVGSRPVSHGFRPPLYFDLPCRNAPSEFGALHIKFPKGEAEIPSENSEFTRDFGPSEGLNSILGAEFTTVPVWIYAEGVEFTGDRNPCDTGLLPTLEGYI